MMNESNIVLSEEEDRDVLNIFFNMASGLTPDHLGEEEVRLLERYCFAKNGHKDWFTDWGYSEAKGWKRSKFDSTVGNKDE